MGKSDAKRRLKRIEREVNKCREQQRHFDKLIDDLESKRQKLLETLGTNAIKLTGRENNQSYDIHQLRRACVRAKNSLEQLKESAEKILIIADDTDNRINTNTNEESHNTSAEKANILDVLNNPTMLKAAQDLMSDLFKED